MPALAYVRKANRCVYKYRNVNFLYNICKTGVQTERQKKPDVFSKQMGDHDRLNVIGKKKKKIVKTIRVITQMVYERTGFNFTYNILLTDGGAGSESALLCTVYCAEMMIISINSDLHGMRRYRDRVLAYHHVTYTLALVERNVLLYIKY